MVRIIGGVLATMVLLVARADAQDTKTGTLVSTNDAVSAPIINVPGQTVQLSGTWVGVVLFEYTVDSGVNWKALPVSVYGTGEIAQAAASNATFAIANAGFQAVRVRAAAMQSGTVTVTFTRGFSVVPALSGAFCNGLLHAAGKC